MTVELVGTDEFGCAVYKGLSTDTKPNAEVGSKFFELDTGKKFEFYGFAGWKIISIGGAASVATSSDSVTAYGAHIETWGDNFTGQAGTNDNDVIYTSPDVTYANNVLIECTTGTVDVYITADGTNYRLATLRSITAAGVVVSDDVELVSTEHGILKESDVGKFTKFQILQKGATASNARGRYGVE